VGGLWPDSAVLAAKSQPSEGREAESVRPGWSPHGSEARYYVSIAGVAWSADGDPVAMGRSRGTGPRSVDLEMPVEGLVSSDTAMILRLAPGRAVSRG